MTRPEVRFYILTSIGTLLVIVGAVMSFVLYNGLDRISRELNHQTAATEKLVELLEAQSSSLDKFTAFLRRLANDPPAAEPVAPKR